MPDRRTHRGPHPQDREIFSEDRIAVLRTAAAEYAWLLDRGYPANASRTLVGNHHALPARAREALRRAVCSAERVYRRSRGRVGASAIAGERVLIDGYNQLVTIEASLSGGLLLFGRDRVIRDLASLHGNYRKVDETIPALEAIGTTLARLSPSQVTWAFDRPVSNSGRLAELVREVAAQHGWPWQAEVVDDPDSLLARTEAIGITSDGPVLEKLDRWYPLVERVIDERAAVSGGPTVWRVDLGAKPSESSED